MAGRIWIGPYKPLGVVSHPIPSGGYISTDARAGQFEASPLAQTGLGVAGAVSEYLANDNEAVVKAADVRLARPSRPCSSIPRPASSTSRARTP
jgi:hypothetical protein